MTKSELITKIKAEGGYQTVQIQGDVIAGQRSCADRWELIKDAVGTGKTVIDFGSHYGYFAMRAADAGNIVMSIEGSSARAEIQKEVLAMTNERNVYLLQRQMAFADWFGLYRSSEAIDTIVALSVLHYIPTDELYDTLWIFSNLAPNLIVEFPPLAETKVASYENVQAIGDFEQVLKTFYKDVIRLGEVPSSTDPNVNRTIYHASNPKIYRHGLSGYLSHRVGGKKHRLTYFNSHWKMDERPIEPAFNARTLLELPELIYPGSAELIQSVAEQYKKEIDERNGNITDINVRNALLIKNGVKVIDTDESVGCDIYGMSWEQYQNKIMGWTVEDIGRHLIDGKI